MGRIKTQLIKRTTMLILDENKSNFSTDYAKNKEVLDSIANIESKKLRNSIAGYITRRIKTNKD